MDFGNQGPLKSGRNLEDQWSAELSMFLGRKWEQQIATAVPRSNRWPTPHWHSAIQCLTYSQNVVGMWLKYGARPRNKGVFALSKIPAAM